MKMTVRSFKCCESVERKTCKPNANPPLDCNTQNKISNTPMSRTWWSGLRNAKAVIQCNEYVDTVTV